MYKLYMTASLALVLLVGLTSNLISFSSGAPAGRAGSPIGQGTCATSSCHGSFALNSGPGTLTLSSDIPATGFIGGDTYTITVNMAEGSINRFAFESTVYGENSMGSAGTLNVSDIARTQKRSSGGNEWITHTFNGISSVDQSSWSYNWVAPTDDDSVTIYAVGMSSNMNGSPAGDNVYSTNIGARRQFGVSINPVDGIQAVKAYPSPASSKLVVEGEVVTNGTMIISLQDLSGREVYRYEDDVTPGSFSNIIDVTAFKSGLYTLRTSVGREVVTKKVVVK